MTEEPSLQLDTADKKKNPQSPAAVKPVEIEAGDRVSETSDIVDSKQTSQIVDDSADQDDSIQSTRSLACVVPTEDSNAPVEIKPSSVATLSPADIRIESAVQSSELLQPTMMNDSFKLSPEEIMRIASNTKPSNSRFASKIATGSSTLTSDEKVQFVNLSLKILFHCKYHALVEYIEAMIPMLYCVYVAILTQLPSHVYYPETRNMTTAHIEKMVGNIFTYAWLEVLSFIVMHYTIKWKFGFSPAYLLAFVLENQAMEFQARLLVWFTYVLEITLVHYGVDLTLKFAWLKGDWCGM